MIRFAVLLALSGCSFAMQGVDPSSPARTEPECSSGAVTLDRIMGASLLAAGGSTILSGQDEPHLAVGGVAAGLGIIYLLAAIHGAQIYVDCQTAKTRWASDHAPRPRRAPRTTPPASPPTSTEPPSTAAPPATAAAPTTPTAAGSASMPSTGAPAPSTDAPRP